MLRSSAARIDQKARRRWPPRFAARDEGERFRKLSKDGRQRTYMSVTSLASIFGDDTGTSTAGKP